jgi:hypothetical protein
MMLVARQVGEFKGRPRLKCEHDGAVNEAGLAERWVRRRRQVRRFGQPSALTLTPPARPTPRCANQLRQRRHCG